MNMLRLAAVGLMLAAFQAPAEAQGDAKSGAQKIRALQCVSCHGRDGVSKLPEAPNLAGQGQDYLKIALAAYRSGARKNEMMSVVAEKLADQDIDDLAAYYSSIEVHVTPPARP